MSNLFNWQKEAEKQWDKRADFWTKSSRDMWDEGSRSTILPFFKKYVQPIGKVIDIGCGDGYGSYKLTSEGGYRVVGVDLSSEMIRLAKERESEELTFLQGDINQLPFENEEAAAILTINCIEWTSDPLRALEELRRIVKPAGYLCIAILGPTSHPRENSFNRLYQKDVICNTMMPWEFEQLATENGWNLVDDLAVYKRGVTEQLTVHLSKELKQSLSFMWVFMLKKR
ncbi:class I SAM-dependent methyltransferase [Metabacillus herbersteinensis]|uniref:Class I SAM-dependent methyltransferase n=1 Tax=Metabacillus herbersteinensis TaxID=283816 RepID=A0ABV6GES8_9BACI